MLDLDFTLRYLVLSAVESYRYVLLVRIILSWFPIQPPDWLRPGFNFLYDLTEPFLRIFRRLLPSMPMGGMALDLSPILGFVVVAIVGAIVRRLLFGV